MERLSHLKNVPMLQETINYILINTKYVKYIYIYMYYQENNCDLKLSCIYLYVIVY